LILTEDEIIETEVAVDHASRPDHVEELRLRFEEQFEFAVKDGAALWERRDTLFPNLVFGERLESDIRALSGGLFVQAFAKLRALDAAAKRWSGSFFDHESIGFKATPESDQTLRMDPSSRTFPCASRQRDCLFSWHLRLTPGAWRLYYEPTAPGLISIGYLGPKLSTSKTKV
jgi:hypothetical protein